MPRDVKAVIVTIRLRRMETAALDIARAATKENRSDFIRRALLEAARREIEPKLRFRAAE